MTTASGTVTPKGGERKYFLVTHEFSERLRQTVGGVAFEHGPNENSAAIIETGGRRQTVLPGEIKSYTTKGGTVIKIVHEEISQSFEG